jgi:trehalose/maltose transport system permease protein
MTSFFKSLPDEIMQSARVDGATAFQTFYMILLPLTLPAMVTTGFSLWPMARSCLMS